MKGKFWSRKRLLSAVMAFSLVFSGNVTAYASQSEETVSAQSENDAATSGTAAESNTMDTSAATAQTAGSAESSANYSETSGSSTGTSASEAGTSGSEAGTTAAETGTEAAETGASGTGANAADNTGADSTEKESEVSDTEDLVDMEDIEDTEEDSTETDSDLEIIFEDDITYINPNYADTQTEADLNEPIDPVTYEETVASVLAAVGDVDVVAEAVDDTEVMEEAQTVYATSNITYYTTAAEAAAAIRSQLVDRAGTVDIYYTFPATDSYSDTMRAVFKQAMGHTGVPDQGDYIAWTYGGFNASLSGYKSNGMAYLKFSYTVTYYTNAAQEEEFASAVDSVFSTLNISGKTSDYEKIKAIYQYICSNVDYDFTNLSDSDYKLKYTAYAALINGTAVCQGYSNLFYYMALKAGVDARFVSGEGNGGAHGWNIVKMGQYYYDVDSTWDSNYDDDFDSYLYFLKIDADFGNHVVDTENATWYGSYPQASRSFFTCPNVEITTISGKVVAPDVTFLEVSDASVAIFGAVITAIDADKNCLYKDADGNEMECRSDVDSGAYYLLVTDDCTVTQVEGEQVKLYARSVSLKGKIIVNYYLSLNSVAEADKDSYLEFYFKDENGNPYNQQSVYLKDRTKTSAGYYCFSYSITAAQMANTIYADYHFGSEDEDEGKTVSFSEYSVQKYGSKQMESSSAAVQAALPLIKAMLNYGAAAQIYFGNNTNHLANEDLDDADKGYGNVTASELTAYAKTKSGSLPEGLSAYGQSLLLNDCVEIRYYYQLTGSKDISSYNVYLVAADGSKTPLTWQKKGSYYYVTVENVVACKLDQMYTVEVTDSVNSLDISYSALSYVYNTLNSSASEDLKNVCRALYTYNQEANAYFND